MLNIIIAGAHVLLTKTVKFLVAHAWDIFLVAAGAAVGLTF